MNPSISRRTFVRSSAAGIGSGTALGSLLALGASIVPATARAQQLRIKDAKATPSVCPYCCRRLRHDRSHDRQRDREHRGRPAQPSQRGCLCPKGAATLPAPQEPEPRHQSAPPEARRDGLGGSRARVGHGPRGRAGQEDPGRDLRRAAHERRPWSTTPRRSSPWAAPPSTTSGTTCSRSCCGASGVVAIENQARI